MARPVGHLHLTFDDGPDPCWTRAVLEALARARARATFFVLGERVDAHPELVTEVLQAGHAVGLHGHRHLRHSTIDAQAGARDTTEGLASLRRAGVRPRRWRTPWGVVAPWTTVEARRHRLTLTHWSADTHDWRGDRPDAMLDAVRDDLTDGAIVLAHDGLGPGASRKDCSATVALIEPLVAAGRARGLEPEVLA